MDEYLIFKSLCRDGKFTFDDAKQALLFYNKFISKGLDVELNSNRIFLNSSIIALDKDIIVSNSSDLTNPLLNKLKIVYETESTNSQLSSDSSCDILLAEYQSSGRGRSGRQWVSPIGHNIYLSLKINNSCMHSFLPLYISLQLAKILKSIGMAGLSIKWPNDLYLHNYKFSGTILESFSHTNELILGLGINVTMPLSYNKTIDQPYTSISQFYSGKLCDRNYLLSHILANLVHLSSTFDKNLIDQYLLEYDQFNLLKGNELIIIESKHKYIATYHCINNDGSLRVLTDNGYKDLYSADVSIRVNKHG